MSMAATMTVLANATGMAQKWDYPVQSADPPCAIVGYPELDPNQLFTSSKTKNRYPVYLLAGIAYERSARDAMSTLLQPVAAGLNAATGSGIDWVNIVSISLQTVTLSSTEYLAAVFSCEVMESI